jgi:hypothetical protein
VSVPLVVRPRGGSGMLSLTGFSPDTRRGAARRSSRATRFESCALIAPSEMFLGLISRKSVPLAIEIGFWSLYQMPEIGFSIVTRESFWSAVLSIPVIAPRAPSTTFPVTLILAMLTSHWSRSV